MLYLNFNFYLGTNGCFKNLMLLWKSKYYLGNKVRTIENHKNNWGEK